MFNLKLKSIIAIALVIVLTVVVIIKFSPSSPPEPLPGDQALLEGKDFKPNKDAPGILEDTELARPKD